MSQLQRVASVEQVLREPILKFGMSAKFFIKLYRTNHLRKAANQQRCTLLFQFPFESVFEARKVVFHQRSELPERIVDILLYSRLQSG
jgi:hypothetical protein